MRHFWIVIIVLLSFTSCDKEETLPLELTTEGIVGKWELYQYRGNNGAEDYITAYKPSGKTIAFLPNRELSSDGFFGCNDGSYEVADLTLKVLFDCEDEVPEQTYSMKIEDQNLILSPIAPSRCRERCAYVFKKID